MDERLNFLYDHQADVLCISKGQPIYTDSIALNDRVILRLNPTTQEIVGFSIVDFMSRFTNRETPASVPLTATFKRMTRISKAVKSSLKKKSK